MLLSKEEFSGVMEKDGWRPLLSTDSLHEKVIAAERAKAAPHFDALPMMDSRELFMAGAEWGNRMAQAGARMADHQPDWIKATGSDNRRAELLELAGPGGIKITLTGDEVAEAITRYVESTCVSIRGPRTVSVNGQLCKYGSIFIDPSGCAILDAVDKEVAK